jgi:hypothetical protein
MVAHQTPGVNGCSVAPAHFTKTTDEQIGIFLRIKNVPALIAATHQVIARTGIFNSKGSGHERKMAL